MFTHTSLSFYIYRYRYLTCFTLIGLLSILLELALVSQFMPAEWPWLAKAGLAFLLGLVFSFVLNACLNFRVPTSHLLQTFGRYAAVSFLSFSLNMLMVSYFLDTFAPFYAQARLISSGLLFLLAYTLHRYYTFDVARNIGLAIYASQTENVHDAFARLGRNCDHVHIDLVDATMAPQAAPVDLDKIKLARKLWPRTPLCLHLMSLTPSRWLHQVWDQVDWCLLHTHIREDLMRLVFECRLRNKKVGIVWHASAPPESLLPFFPHVDFVMVLGIAEPGRSGQAVSGFALELTELLDRLRHRYGFEVMFDGGVKITNIRQIRAKYIVSASAVLQAEDPIRAAHALRTNAKYVHT